MEGLQWWFETAAGRILLANSPILGHFNGVQLWQIKNVVINISMKKQFILATAIFALGLLPALAQFGSHGGPGGPHLGGSMDKLFGDTHYFSADLQFQTQPAGDNMIVMPGKISFDSGKSRFEMNMSEAQGMKMPPQAIQQMKSMGMDNVISISRPDLKEIYIVYPGLNSYVEMPAADSAAGEKPEDYKMDTEKLGAEKLDGHDCVKNKVTITDKLGGKHISTVWNATDLKNFPIQIVTTQEETTVTMIYKKISFEKPAASTFEVPTSLTRYGNMQAMLQAEMMKRMGGMAAPQPEK